MPISKLFKSIVFLLVLIASAAGQSYRQRATQNGTSHPPNVRAADSLSSASEPLSSPVLESPYGSPKNDSPFRPSLFPPDRSWLAEPDTMQLAEPPLELLFESSSNVYTDHGPSPIQRGSWLLNSRTNLMSPWKLQMQSRDKYHIWQTIFRSIEAGGVAYLMYLNIRKYGLK